MDAHTNALWRQAWMLTGQRQDAEDLLQETLVRLALAWSRVDTKAAPVAYARTTMARLHVSRWRAAQRRVRLVLGGPAETAAPHDPTSAIDDAAELRTLLATLTPRERAVLVLGYLEDASDETIAETLDVAPGTVRSLRSRALARLRADHADTATSATTETTATASSTDGTTLAERATP